MLTRCLFAGLDGLILESLQNEFNQFNMNHFIFKDMTKGYKNIKYDLGATP